MTWSLPLSIALHTPYLNITPPYITDATPVPDLYKSFIPPANLPARFHSLSILLSIHSTHLDIHVRFVYPSTYLSHLLLSLSWLMSSHLNHMIITHYLVPSIYRAMCMFSSSLDLLSLFQDLLISILLCFSLSTYLPTYLPVYPFIQPSIYLSIFPSFHLLLRGRMSTQVLWHFDTASGHCAIQRLTRAMKNPRLSAPAQRSSRCCWQSCFDFIRLKVLDSFHLAPFQQTNLCQPHHHTRPTFDGSDQWLSRCSCQRSWCKDLCESSNTARSQKKSNYCNHDALTHG